MESFSERLQQLMTVNHITQRQLAEMVGVTEPAMSRYVRGERTPHAKTIANIATALHTTSDYLLGRDTEHDVDYDFTQIRRIIARNASVLTVEQKTELIKALFGEE